MTSEEFGADEWSVLYDGGNRSGQSKNEDVKAARDKAKVKESKAKQLGLRDRVGCTYWIGLDVPGSKD